MNPNAGIGKWSLDFVLKIVFLMFPGRDGGEEADGAIAGFMVDFFVVVSFLSVFEVEALSLDAVTFFEVLALVIFFFFLFLSALDWADLLLDSSLRTDFFGFWASMAFPSLMV